MAAQFCDCRTPFDAGGMGWGQRQELIEIGFEAGEIDFERGVGDPVTSASDAASAAEEMAQSGSEDLVAFVDDELGVAKQMSEADLVVFFRPAVLRAKAVRDPGVGTKGAEELFDRDLAASRMGQEIGVVAVMENPQPLLPTRNPVSSEQIALADKRRARIAALAAWRRSRAALRILTRPPSLISRPRRSRINRDKRSNPTTWGNRR